MGLRVIFMGTPGFAMPALEAILDSEHEVLAVYSQPPRPAGRGQKLTPSVIHQLAQSRGIEVRTPVTLKDADTQGALKALKADVAVVAAYGLLLPQAVLNAPRLGCINIHPSSLPRWRGAAPLQRTIMAGDTQTECCIMQMEAGLDTGPVLKREAFTIPPDMDTGALHDAMALMGAQLVVEVLDALEKGPVKAEAQGEDGLTYAAKISKADQVIDWTRPAGEIIDQVRALSPAPGATFRLGEEICKLYRVTFVMGKTGAPGTVLDEGGVVACGSGAVQLLELQKPGKQRCGIAEFLNGAPLPQGTVLG